MRFVKSNSAPTFIGHFRRRPKALVDSLVCISQCIHETMVEVSAHVQPPSRAGGDGREGDGRNRWLYSYNPLTVELI